MRAIQAIASETMLAVWFAPPAPEGDGGGPDRPSAAEGEPSPSLSGRSLSAGRLRDFAETLGWDHKETCQYVLSVESVRVTSAPGVALGLACPRQPGQRGT